MKSLGVLLISFLLSGCGGGSAATLAQSDPCYGFANGSWVSGPFIMTFEVSTFKGYCQAGSNRCGQFYIHDRLTNGDTTVTGLPPGNVPAYSDCPASDGSTCSFTVSGSTMRMDCGAGVFNYTKTP